MISKQSFDKPIMIHMERDQKLLRADQTGLLASQCYGTHTGGIINIEYVVLLKYLTVIVCSFL